MEKILIDNEFIQIKLVAWGDNIVHERTELNIYEPASSRVHRLPFDFMGMSPKSFIFGFSKALQTDIKINEIHEIVCRLDPVTIHNIKQKNKKPVKLDGKFYEIDGDCYVPSENISNGKH